MASTVYRLDYLLLYLLTQLALINSCLLNPATPVHHKTVTATVLLPSLGKHLFAHAFALHLARGGAWAPLNLSASFFLYLHSWAGKMTSYRTADPLWRIANHGCR